MVCINKNISFEDIIKLSINYRLNNVYKINYYDLWKKKVSFINKYYQDYYKKEKYDFNFFNGLSYNALNILKLINYNKLSYGKSIKRFYNIKTIYDLYNPSNIEVGPIVNSYAEYIKYELFYNNRRVEYEKIFNIGLNREDYYFLIARLLFPTYYYDLFKDDNIRNSYNNIIEKIEDYIIYIKEIIISIKKRHNNMPYLDYFINLL